MSGDIDMFFAIAPFPGRGRQAHTLTFIPWFSWANRGEGEMRIWINEQ